MTKPNQSKTEHTRHTFSSLSSQMEGMVRPFSTTSGVFPDAGASRQVEACRNTKNLAWERRSNLNSVDLCERKQCGCYFLKVMGFQYL